MPGRITAANQAAWLKSSIALTGKDTRTNKLGYGDMDIARIIYHEARSLADDEDSGELMNRLAHTLMNQSEVYLAGGQRVGVHNVSLNPAQLKGRDKALYQQISDAVRDARAERNAGEDPSSGALWFVMSGTKSESARRFSSGGPSVPHLETIGPYQDSRSNVNAQYVKFNGIPRW